MLRSAKSFFFESILSTTNDRPSRDTPSGVDPLDVDHPDVSVDVSVDVDPRIRARDAAGTRGRRVAFLLFALFAAWFIISTTWQISCHALSQP